MKQFIEQNFTLVLIIGVLAGLFAPGVDKLPDISAILLIAAVIFFSCSRICLADMREFNVKAASLFYVFRFILLPMAFYAVALMIIPTYAMGVLLVMLMPTGVAASAMCHLTGGNASLALAATVVTNALTPFTVPLIISLCAAQHIDIDAQSMLITLGLSVFIPALTYFFIARNINPIKKWVGNNAQCYSIALVGGMATCVVGMRREYFFSQWDIVLLCLALGIILFALLYAIGWFYARSMRPREKLTYSICSGTNNIALSAALAVLYFSPETVIFTVVGGEIAWIVGVDVFKRLSPHITKNSAALQH